MKDKTIIVLTAIACVTALECVALSQGIDGAAFASVLVVIGGLAGYEIKAKRG